MNFIVRAVDDILKTEFYLKDGLADTSKIKIKKQAFTKATSDRRSKLQEVEVEEEVHRVQILDPATGTGTFLAEVVRHIHKKFKGQEGIWSKYVANDLIPRLNGVELLMASYAMAHLKMDMLFTETGYKPTSDQRFRIFLTNSLEEHHPDTGTLFSSWLADEANQANAIKRDAPVMVVMGNPPYSGISSNNGEWISNLINDYKYVDGVHFNERKHWLNDDYVKFIRFGQHFIDKNGEGVLAFINPHGFLDNPTFRGMRWNLMQSFDKIYTIDLHGNSKKNEISPDGSVDQNVFDIMQGVSINIFINTGKNKSNGLSIINHFDLYGKRNIKYDFLIKNSLKDIDFKELKPVLPNLFFVPKDNENVNEYEEGFQISKLFNLNSTGIQTSRDKLVIDFSKNTLSKRIKEFSDSTKSDDEIRNKFFPNKKADKYKVGDTRGWKIETARKKLNLINIENYIVPVSYRPFDKRFIFYSDIMIDWTRSNVMKHLESKENFCLLIPRQLAEDKFHHVLVEDSIAEMCVISNKTKEQNVVFPLYIYREINTQKTIHNETTRTPNLNPEIVNKITTGLGLTFTPEKEKEGEVCFANNPEVRPEFKQTFAPIDLLDYIYAVLHSPSYREKYKEFLKIDFPRVPYPTDAHTFWKLVALGGELRQLHLLETEKVEGYITQYPEDGDNIVGKVMAKHEAVAETDDPKLLNVYINETQYFKNVPEIAWNFYIGGYQPAQKWLKDRKGRELSMEDIFHYQKMIVALSETERVMGEIDKIIS